MPGIPDHLQAVFSSLTRLTNKLNRMIESGEFHSLPRSERRKLLRKVKRLYNKLVGPVAPRAVAGALAAGVLFLAGCF